MTFCQTRRANFQDALDRHQIKGKGLVGLSLPVVLLSSDNPYLSPGARGVLTIIEQGTDLSVIVATFRALVPTTHSLDVAVECKRPVFVYAPIDHRSAQERIEQGAAQ
jgi:hypothetical protein